VPLKIFENRSIFGEDIDNDKWGFFGDSVFAQRVIDNWYKS